jgi:hypothetical protein
MIISHILGGIGNQMFQYAAGRALSLTNSQQYLLDLSDFSNYRLHHGFELSRVFNVIAESAETSTVNEMLGWRASRVVRKVLRRPQFVCLRGKKFVVEPYFKYWPSFFNLTDSCYLSGYWQSERYFKPFENIVRQDFTFREPLSGRNAELALAIGNTQAVSLHVRRGDYVSDSKTSNIMEVCSLDYYHKAITYIAELIERPEFYIFSDDIAWVKKNLSIPFPCTYVEHNRQTESYRDMQLMSLCQYHVIANSSFSWWGAWLSSNPKKLTIAPKKWFCNGTDDCNLILNDWVRL